MKIEVNGIYLNYTKAGKGKNLILLHGNGEDHHIFDKLINKLKNDFTVYALDSRNHGKSSKTDDYSYGSMSGDIYEFIKKLELKEVSVVGFSDGAIIALLLAMKHKNIFNKVALLGVNLKPSDFKKNIFKEIEKAYQATNDPLLKMMLEEPNIELDALKGIITPTLVVAGQNDLFYRKTFTDIVAVLPNASLKIMKGYDHGSYIVDQDILAPDLKDFLK
ncbi:MAG: alpha/beta fold hydrolase [Dysgonomonas sp.]